MGRYTTVRKASPAQGCFWWIMTVCTFGLWAFFVGKPKK